MSENNSQRMKMYRVNEKMEEVIVEKTVKEFTKTRVAISKQQIFEKIFWLGVANETEKSK